MEHISIQIEDENVAINSDCSQDNFMKATSVMFASMAQNSSNTVEELLEIIKENTLAIIENSSLKQTEVGGTQDEI